LFYVLPYLHNTEKHAIIITIIIMAAILNYELVGVTVLAKYC